MAATNDFFTLQSFATVAGTTLIATAVTNGLRKAISGLQSSTWLGLLVAIVVCLLAATLDLHTGAMEFRRPPGIYILAIFNGFFVFASAAGLSAAGEKAFRSQPDDTRGSRGRASDVAFWRRWF
jgi:hypothetical protein